jgi:DNA-binding beta-propeller fold protein YncE
MKHTLLTVLVLAIGIHAASLAAGSPPRQTAAAKIELVAGGGTSVEGAPASACRISQPFGIAFDAQDNMFICEETHRLLRVDARTGVLTVVSGAKKAGAPLGDGGSVQQASFAAPHNLVADAQGNLFIADSGNHLIRKFVVSQQKLITLAGTGAKGAAGVPGPALQAQLGEPHGVTTHPRTGDIYIADSRNHRVLRIKAKTWIQ